MMRSAPTPYRSSGADAALFQIVGTELFLVALRGATLDFETNPVLDVTVEVDDLAVGATPDDTAPLAITITDVNEPPTVALANTTTPFPTFLSRRTLDHTLSLSPSGIVPSLASYSCCGHCPTRSPRGRRPVGRPTPW